MTALLFQRFTTLNRPRFAPDMHTIPPPTAPPSSALEASLAQGKPCCLCTERRRLFVVSEVVLGRFLHHLFASPSLPLEILLRTPPYFQRKKVTPSFFDSKLCL
jgi:hypothetical protein